jgi:hypothetical protein
MIPPRIKLFVDLIAAADDLGRGAVSIVWHPV